ncbi:MAG: 30S ribosomal protein S16 [Thermodesulfovibrio sp.]|nr:30S ribosomal protein S16 [Thermodesulfovibrio sp.]
MVRIRLMRMGAKKKPFYRVVVADSKARRDGPFIEIVGTYNPKTDPAEIKLNMERINYWISKGAQPTDTVKKLIETVTS